MTLPEIGAVYRYTGDRGLAAHARITDPDVDDELPSEMRELDLTADVQVTAVDFDTERNLVIVEWVDRSGNPRRTSIDPGVFFDRFTEV